MSVRVSIAIEYVCQTEADAIEVIQSVMRETVDYSNRGLTIITTHLSFPEGDVMIAESVMAAPNPSRRR